MTCCYALIRSFAGSATWCSARDPDGVQGRGRIYSIKTANLESPRLLLLSSWSVSAPPPSWTSRADPAQSSGVAVNAQCLEVFQSLKLGKSTSLVPPALSDRVLIREQSSSTSSSSSRRPTRRLSWLPLPPRLRTMISWRSSRPRAAATPSTISSTRSRARVVATSCASTPGACSQRDSTALMDCRSPDEAKIKTKMLYASSKDALRRALVGISTEIQGTDFSEVAYDAGTASAPPHADRTDEIQCSTRSRAVLSRTVELDKRGGMMREWLQYNRSPSWLIARPAACEVAGPPCRPCRPSRAASAPHPPEDSRS